MREQLERRLTVLRNEYESGQKQAAEIESRLASLRATLARISGAIHQIETQVAQTTNCPAR